jgi:hypothetical protein
VPNPLPQRRYRCEGLWRGCEGFGSAFWEPGRRPPFAPSTAFPGSTGQRDHAGEPVGEVGYLCLGIEMYTEKAMARDYYPLLARAIASLEQNTADARQVVYDHARRVLREQERMDEMLALEEAIDKVELEAAGAP